MDDLEEQVSEVDPVEEQVSDVDLIERLRQGDRDATVELWTRHYPSVLLAARRVTRQPRDAEEIASDAFSGMLSAVDSGAGPTSSVRAYLVTSVRNLAASRSRRSSSSEVITDDVAVFDRPTRDTTAHMSELELVRVAFAALPRRWQIVLWRTAVDKDTNIDVGRAMDLSPNGVAALAKRARRGFRLSYLRAHLSDRGVAEECEPFIDGLADLAVSESTTAAQVADHVEGCPKCTGRLAELRHVDRNFAGVLFPVIFGLVPAKALVGAAGASAPAAATAVAAGSGSGLGWGWWNLVPRTPVQWGLAATGAVGASTVALALALGAGSDATPASPTAGGFAAPPLPSLTTSVAPPVVTPTEEAPEPPVEEPDDSPEPVNTPDRTPDPSTPAPTSSPTPTATPSPTPTKVPSPTPTPSGSPSPTATPGPSPLTVGLVVRGPRPDTSIDVSAYVEGTKGPLRLNLTLPDGVFFFGAEGDWASCEQTGNEVACVADPGTSATQAGTLRTVWFPSSQGVVRATVSGTYADGSPATGSREVSWPS